MPCSKIYCVTVVGAVVAVAGAIFALFWGDIFDAVIVKVRDLLGVRGEDRGGTQYWGLGVGRVVRSNEPDLMGRRFTTGGVLH